MASTLILAAHPDDETIGCGGLLGHLSDVKVVHLTDGAPRQLRFYPRGLDVTPESYAAIRHNEVMRAMNKAGLNSERVGTLGARDQEASWDLVRLVEALYDWISTEEPSVIITHPYEGGHPDHDAACFVAHAATALVRRSGRRTPRLIEMTAYHLWEGRFRSGEFLVGCSARATEAKRQTNDVAEIGSWISAPNGLELIEWVLWEADRRRKQEMFECFDTQRETLQAFTPGRESYRRAPRYCFREPPHEGVLYYEQPGCTIVGAEWRALAAEAARALELEEP